MAAALAATTAFVAPSARADGPSQGDLLFQEGRAALTRGNLLEACNKLAQSDRVEPTGRAALNLADCLERRGMVSSAYTKFLDVATRAQHANRPDAERHARERAARLEPRLGRITVVVPKEAEVPGLEIWKDGARLPPTSWNVAQLADPGTAHTYEANAPGKKPWSTTLTIEEGHVAQAEVRLAPTNARPPQQLETPRVVLATATEPSRAPVYAAFGVGAAGVITGTVAGLAVLGAKSTITAHCMQSTHQCDAQGLDAASSGKTWSIVSPVALAVGAIGLGTGAFLLVRGGTREPVVAVSPIMGPGGCGFAVAGSL